jgi:hypothetical protein
MNSPPPDEEGLYKRLDQIDFEPLNHRFSPAS